MEGFNQTSMDTVCGSLCYAMGVEPPEHAVTKSEDLCRYVDEALEGRKADRIFMYNPDAIAQWLWQKYPRLFRDIDRYVGLELPIRTVVPSVTPVCFSTMYTGAQPSVHGVTKKQILKIDTFFDAMLRAGKKIALISNLRGSMSTLYLEREMDYYLFNSMEQGIAKASELILKDEYDIIIVYSGFYDKMMHHYGPESVEALSELRVNAATFGILSDLIDQHWKNHDTLVGFAMDHGCHADVTPEGDLGDHGLDITVDVNVMHLYKAYPRNKD